MAVLNPAPQETYYDDVTPEKMILRDHLALDRTELANERTLLAYIRTAMALFLTGFSAMHLPSFNPNLAFEDLVYQSLGWALVAAAMFRVGRGLGALSQGQGADRAHGKARLIRVATRRSRYQSSTSLVRRR